MSRTPLEIAKEALRRIAQYPGIDHVAAIAKQALADMARAADVEWHDQCAKWLAQQARAAATEPAGGQNRDAGAELAKPEKRP